MISLESLLSTDSKFTEACSASEQLRHLHWSGTCKIKIMHEYCKWHPCSISFNLNLLCVISIILTSHHNFQCSFRKHLATGARRWVMGIGKDSPRLAMSYAPSESLDLFIILTQTMDLVPLRDEADGFWRRYRHSFAVAFLKRVRLKCEHTRFFEKTLLWDIDLGMQIWQQPVVSSLISPSQVDTSGHTGSLVRIWSCINQWKLWF